MPNVYVSTDFSALRHTEHLAASGWCGCTRGDYALTAEMHQLSEICKSPDILSRYIWSHEPPPGEDIPRKCTAPGCSFAHYYPSTALQEYKSLLATEATFLQDKTKAGKVRFSMWRMAYALSHYNVCAALYLWAAVVPVWFR